MALFIYRDIQIMADIYSWIEKIIAFLIQDSKVLDLLF